MIRDIFNYIVMIGTQQWYFEDFKTATAFINSYAGVSEYTRIYKLVCVNGELVKDGKK